jgi:hypothetical protein
VALVKVGTHTAPELPEELDDDVAPELELELDVELDPPLQADNAVTAPHAKHIKAFMRPPTSVHMGSSARQAPT